MKKTALLLCALVALPLSAGTHAKTTTKTADIVDTAVAAGQFKTLAAALGAAGLVDTLKGSGPFTVFAPTDAAFAKLGDKKIQELLKPENRETLKAILTYHVVAGSVSSGQAADLRAAKTVQGGSVGFNYMGDSLRVNEAKVLTADIATSNGVIHVIDTVLLP
ncbi:MAG: fasciclin domain-containing protein [Thermoanaerobaculia bacterium]|nr:fasciclin domain-containing protein [Thermoanaerobaculia bacterium]